MYVYMYRVKRMAGGIIFRRESRKSYSDTSTSRRRELRAVEHGVETHYAEFSLCLLTVCGIEVRLLHLGSRMVAAMRCPLQMPLTPCVRATRCADSTPPARPPASASAPFKRSSRPPPRVQTMNGSLYQSSLTRTSTRALLSCTQGR